MKKALKTIFIVILCLAAAAGTGYLFFANLTKSVSAFESVNAFYNSVEQHELQSKIRKVVVNDSARFNQLNRTYADLKTTMFYTSANVFNLESTSVGNNVNKKLTVLKNSSNQLELLLDEYAVKCEVEGFDKVAGADDLYVQFAKYLCDYAEFVDYLNQIASQYVSTSAIDLRFAITDLYVNVVKTSLADISSTDTDLPTLAYMWNHYYVVEGYISTKNPNGDFAIENNKFIEHYNKCNKQSFAKNLIFNLTIATADAETDELRATYYLNIIMGN